MSRMIVIYFVGTFSNNFTSNNRIIKLVRISLQNYLCLFTRKYIEKMNIVSRKQIV